MATPGPVRIREGRIEELITLYQLTYAKLVTEITTATDAGKIQKARVMARINAELASLGVDVEEWVKKEIPQYYLDGANVAVQDLRALGVDVTKAGNFAVINAEAIKALTDEVISAFGSSITTISRNARGLLDLAVRQQISFIIAEGKLTGEARRTVSAAVKKAIEDNGITALADRSGKRWTFENYSRMLVRTKAVEARNQGLMNRMLTSGYDLVQVSNHRSAHAECAKWESKVLSMTGQTPTGTVLPGGFTVAGTYQQAAEAGLFHPNCEHAINVLVPSLAAKTKAYDNAYNNR